MPFASSSSSSSSEEEHEDDDVVEKEAKSDYSSMTSIPSMASTSAHLTFASMHALSAWLSVKSMLLSAILTLEKNESDASSSSSSSSSFAPMFSLAHRGACLVNVLRSLVKTYREMRNENRVQSRRRRKTNNNNRRGRRSFKKETFLRNTQTNAHDAKSALERANEALFTADAVLDTDDFDLDYDNEETNRMNLKSLGALALSGVFGNVNDEFKDGRYPTAKERQLMLRFVDALTSVGFGAALRLTAGIAWSLDYEIGRNRAIETVFVASRAVEKEKRKEASKSLGLEGLTTRFRSNSNSSSSNSSSSSSSSKNSRGDGSGSPFASPFDQWRKNGGGRNESKKKPPVVNSSLSKATKQKMKIVDKKDFKRPAVVNPKDTFGTRRLLFSSSTSATNATKERSRAKSKENGTVKKIARKDAKRAQDDAGWLERAKERLPRVAPVILILAGFIL